MARPKATSSTSHPLFRLADLRAVCQNIWSQAKSRVTKPRAPLLAALLGGVGGGGGLSAEPQAGVLQAAVPKTLPGQWKDAASCGAMPTSWVLRAPKAAMRTRHPSTAPTHKAATI